MLLRKTWKQYKKRFLKAEAAQHSQWGLIDMFVRYGSRVYIYGFLSKEHSKYHDFSYAELRGWRRKN